jgi:hypothetical protein
MEGYRHTGHTFLKEALESAKQTLSPVCELLFDSSKALLGNAMCAFLGGLTNPPRSVRCILGKWHGSGLRKLLEDNHIIVGHISVRSSRAAELSNVLMEQLTKHSSLTPGFKQKFSLKEWFPRLPEMSVEEKFTRFSILKQSSPRSPNPSYLQLNSEAADKKKAYRQKKKKSKES